MHYPHHQISCFTDLLVKPLHLTLTRVSLVGTAMIKKKSNKSIGELYLHVGINFFVTEDTVKHLKYLSKLYLNKLSKNFNVTCHLS